MTIMVDNLVAWPGKAKSGGRYFGSGKESCHMTTDGDMEEIHAFAARIGLKRAWFQEHKILPHYDLTPARRAAAVRAGAVEMNGTDMLRAYKAAKAARDAAKAGS
jgi:hypothetical protein